MDFTAAFHQTYRVAQRVGQNLCREASDFLKRAKGWQIALTIALGLLALAVVLPLAIVLAALALLIAAFLAWLHEFILLMRLPDEAFPGRFDKLVWASLLILLPPIGLLAFWSFRKAHWTEKPLPTRPGLDDWF